MTIQIWNILNITLTLLLVYFAVYAFIKEKARKKNEERLLQENELLRQEIADYEESILSHPSQENEELTVRESLLVQQLKEAVEVNYTDPEFNVDKLAAALDLSRSSLNRKIREILHTTANNYIREVRLEKAEELLRTSSLQINEICYKVGFQTPSYFIKCFKNKYEKSPYEYAKSI